MLTNIDGKTNQLKKSLPVPADSVAKNSAVQLKDNRPASIIQKKQVDALSKKTNDSPIQKKENNTGLPDNLKSGIENLSGHSMDDVKVHYNSSQPAQLNAHAYAQGTNIHIAPGQEKHLPHEAWHVVQQKQGRVKPTLQMKSKVNINDDKSLEKEADVMGAKAIQAKGNNTKLEFASSDRKIIQAKIDNGKFLASVAKIPDLHNEVEFAAYKAKTLSLLREYQQMPLANRAGRREKLSELNRVMIDIQFHELTPAAEHEVDKLRSQVFDEITEVDDMPDEAAEGLEATSRLLALLKSGPFMNAEKGAKEFSKTGGVGRDLVPPNATYDLSRLLFQDSALIIGLLHEIKAWMDFGGITPHYHNLIFEAVGRCMRLINLVTDGVNKAEANVRVWIKDGNGAETDGVQPQRNLTLRLMPIWDVAQTIHQIKKKGFLAAPIARRHENMAGRSYAALR